MSDKGTKGLESFDVSKWSICRERESLLLVVPVFTAGGALYSSQKAPTTLSFSETGMLLAFSSGLEGAKTVICP